MANSGAKIRNIDEIKDVYGMIQAMAALNISCQGFTNLDDMKKHAKDELAKLAKSPSLCTAEASSILSDVKKEDERKRGDLLKLFVKTEKYMSSDIISLTLLQKKMKNVIEEFEKHKMELSRKEYFVLVAGESGSGKSSLINLILGEKLLPYSVLSTTSTICELKYGKDRRIVAHYKEKDPETGQPTRIIHLTECQAETSEQGYLEQISPYVHVKGDREKASPFKKIELFWPHRLLEEGIVIIDSPGVGESAIMDEIVTQYLPQAFAFIYVINSTNSGGVQKDRLEKLLADVRNVAFETLGGLPSECQWLSKHLSKCALFVCNKWDQVPEEEAKDVENHVTRKLQSCWPGVDPKLQIMHMSTTNANKAQEHGCITKEFSNLMNGIKVLVEKSVGARLEIHWKWLNRLLTEIMFQTKAFLMKASNDKDKVVEKIAQIVLRLEAIEKQQNETGEELRKVLQDCVQSATLQLLQFVASEDFIARFTSWTLEEIPKQRDNWQDTKDDIIKALSNRLQTFIKQWEEDNKVFANSRETVTQHFEKRYHYVEGQLRNLQSAVTADDIPMTTTAKITRREVAFTFGEKMILGVTSPIWVPLAVVVGVPVVGVAYIKGMLAERNQMKAFEKDKCAFMRENSKEYLESASANALTLFARQQFRESAVTLKQIEERIPELIEADKLLFAQLLLKTSSQMQILKHYEPIKAEVSRLIGDLTLFGITEVRAHISSKNLDWDENRSPCLGRGAFGAVYEGVMTVNEDSRTVALKVFNEPLDANNASGCMDEVELLRILKHPHIVKFYGTSLIREQDSVRMILVLEKCKVNLKRYIFDHEELVPATSRSPEAFKKVCQWVKELTDALSYIHEQGIVHRDLKLENILLSEGDSVKVTDVGISKEAKDITGTIAGSPVYMAPEVFRAEVYDKKADIYSLGIMLWEIWYGQQAFADSGASSMKALFAMVDEGSRPKPIKGLKKPHLRWQELMDQCWDANPDKRPSACQCHERISDIALME